MASYIYVATHAVWFLTYPESWLMHECIRIAITMCMGYKFINVPRKKFIES